MTELETAEEAYELAEAAYLAGIRADADRGTLGGLAADPAAKSAVWNSFAYRAFHVSGGEPTHEALDWLTERTEVLSQLWTDARDAYLG